jgi:large subunit ribosomal protein L24
VKIRKNDNVLIIAGKDRGKKGKVRLAYPGEDRIVIEGLNLVKKHVKSTKEVKQTGTIEREAPVSVADVMLVCNKCNHPARVGFRILKDGKKVRTCSVCHEVID